MSTTGNVQQRATTEDSDPKSKPRVEFWGDMTLRSLTLVCLIIGTAFGLVKYFEDRHKEYEFTLYKERKEMYYPLCRAAAEIVSSKTLQEAAPAIKSFETLYYAGVRSVAERDVNDAINDFGDALLEFKSGPLDGSPPPELINLLDTLGKKTMNALALQRVFGLAQGSQRKDPAAPAETPVTEPAPAPESN
jgi:hypothetical protein